MGCDYNCRLCNRIVISSSVTVVGTNLVINIPEGSYANGCRYCLVIAQTIPSTATISMPVVITIGTSTTQYPLVKCNCAPVTACALRTRTRYPMVVSTTATSGVFKVLRNLCCAPTNVLASLPAPTAPAAPATAEATFTADDAAALSDSKSVTKTVTTKTTLKAE